MLDCVCMRPSEAMERRRDPIDRVPRVERRRAHQRVGPTPLHPWDAINDSVGKFCTDNWTERKRYQPMVQNKLLSTIQAYSLGFLTGNPVPWKRFCLFCLF